MKPFQIIVPATSANMGPGFDSIGVALNLYLTIDVAKNDRWEIIHESSLLPDIKQMDQHFIYQTIKNVSHLLQVNIPPCKLTITSQIPLARGLGSSASAIVASIEVVNQLGGLHLSKKRRLELATKIEGHPDNVTPALYGGITLSMQKQDKTIEIMQLPENPIHTIVYIPPFELSTKKARDVLPSHYKRETATLGSSVSNLMVASLIMGDYARAGMFMEEDVFHEPYRKTLLPDFETIRREAKKHGAYGTTISGAGPTIISFVSSNQQAAIASQMKQLLSNYQIETLQIDNKGLRVT